MYLQNCPNSNFSNLNFNNWIGTTGTTPALGFTPYSYPGFVADQHTIISTPGLDPQTLNNLSMLPPGGSTSCRLGNPVNGYGAESMTYQMQIDNTNNLFIYEYAMVLQDPGSSHSIAEKPKFIVKVMDLSNNVLSGNCSYYETYGGDPNNNFAYVNNGVTYSDWKKVAIDLSNYSIPAIKIQFTTLDCDQGGHWGYAYLSTYCRNLSIDMVKNCDGTVVLTAPPGFHSYLWSPGGQLTQSITLNNLSTGNYSYSCSMNAIADLSCPSQIDTTFDYIATPTINVNDETICIGESITLNSTCNEVGGTYSWSPDGQITPSIIVSPTTTTNYILSYSALNNCIYTDTATIIVNPLPAFTVQDVSVCMNDTITLSPTPTNLTYTWSNGVINNVPFVPLISNTYTVNALDPLTGCIDEQSIFVTVNPNPIANFTFVCASLPTLFTNASIGGNNYIWNMGDGEELHYDIDIDYSFFDLENEYYPVTLTAISEFGCRDSITKNFIPPFLHYVPNTFTPDYNEFNNVFIPIFSQKDRIDNYTLTIYNRWGEVVFESYDIKQGWDGMYINEKAQDGTYNWEILYNESRCYNKRLHFHGNVNLIR